METATTAPVSLQTVAARVVERYFALRNGERFLIVTDTAGSPAIAASFLEAASAVGGEAAHALIEPLARSGEEPPSEVATAMKEADVCLCAASRSLYHTSAKGEAQAAGTRGCFNAPWREEAWLHGAMTADFIELRALAERLATRLRRATHVRVTSPAGTDLVVETGGREPKGVLTGICRNRGEISAFPGGEVSFPPLEGTAHGAVVVERVMTDLGRVDEPIIWTVRDGLCVDVDGGAEAQRLRELIDGVPGATNIAELGIGINGEARIGDDITEAKKRAGTAHVALGDNAGGYGGVVECPLHLDGLVLCASIDVDDEAVVVNGEVVV